MKTIKVFLASSSELKEDRVQFEIFINRENKEWIKKGYFFELIIWEDFVDAMSLTRLQDEYNKAIVDCDIFIMLFFTKVGKYTEEEFSIALKQFQSTKHPIIYAYQKDIPFRPTKEFQTVTKFTKRLDKLGHFCSTYTSNEDLHLKINKQLIKLFLFGNQSVEYPSPPVKKELTKFEKIANDEIIGRENELKEIRDILFDDKKVIIVNGLGGIGKTMLAQAYASRFYDDYKYIAWISQGDEPAIKAFINNKELIKNLGLDYSELSRYEENEQVKRILTRHSDINDKPNLLVIDNSDKTICDIKQYLPGTPDWHVLITSREEIGIEHNCVNKKLDFLREEKAIELFKKHCDIKIYSDDQIYTLLKTVEYHTLTIEILAKTAKLRRTKFHKILCALEDDLKASISLSRETEQIDRITTYLKSIFNFTKLDENEIWVLKQFCFLPPDYHSANIIEILFQIEKLNWYEDFYMALNSLEKKGWLLYNKETDSFKMHRIIYEVAIAKIPPLYEDIKLLFQKIGELLDSEEDVDDYLEHTEWMPFGENILELIVKYKVFNQFETKPEIYTIQKNIGWLYDEIDEYEKAKIALERALESATKDLGFENTFVTDCQSKLAMILNKLGESEKARDFLEQVIETDIKILDNESDLLALHRNNLAVVYATIGEYNKALDLMTVVIESEIKNFGDKAARISIRYSVLAGIYSYLKENEKAKEYYEKSLEINRMHFPENHPRIAHTLFSLGVLYFDRDNKKAKEAFEKAFNIYSEHFKENSENVASAEYYLGMLYLSEIKDTNDKIEIEKACNFLERSLSTRIEKNGINSLAVAQIQYILGIILYYTKNEKEEGKDILEAVLKTRIEKLGENHKDVADVQFQLGKVYSDMEENEKARDLFERALRTRTEQLGENHADVADVQFELGGVYYQLEEIEKALKLYEKVLAFYKNTLEPNDQKIGNIQFNLGRIYSEKGENEKAKEVFESSLTIHIKTYGEEHKETSLVEYKLAWVYYQLEENEKARELYEKVLTFNKEIEEKDERFIAIIENELAQVYIALEKYAGAIELLESSLASRIKIYGEEHVEVAKVQFILGRIYYQLDENEKAKDILEKVLDFSIKKYPEDDHNIGDVLLELGRVYSDLNDKKKACDLLEQSLNIHIKIYGKEHVEVAKVQFILGRIYYLLDENEKARDILEKVLAFSIAKYPEDDHSIGDVLLELGRVYSDLNDKKKACDLLEQSLNIHIKKYGEEHQEVAIVQQLLGGIYYQLDENEKAQELYEKVLAFYQNTLEPNDQKIGNIQFNLGRIYSEQGEDEKAKEVIESSLAIHIKNYGEEHQEVAVVQQLLGVIYYQLDENEKACQLMEEALKIYRVLSKQNPGKYNYRVANVLRDLAYFQYKTNLKKAVQITKEATDILTTIDQKDDRIKSDISICHARMARYMILSKQFSEAEKNARLAVESDPLKTVSQKNLAHSILYQGKYNEAEAYYKEFKNDADIREQILLDFDEFEQAGITDPGVAKIRVLLEN